MKTLIIVIAIIFSILCGLLYMTYYQQQQIQQLQVEKYELEKHLHEIATMFSSGNITIEIIQIDTPEAIPN